jgi:hypothetical protein
MLHMTSNLRAPSRRRSLGVALATVTAVAAFGGSAAAQAKTHHYKSVIKTAQLSTGNGYPGSGGTAVLAGTWVTDLFGNGAVVDYVTITGQPSPNTLTFRGTEVGFVGLGTLKDKFTGTATILPDGSQRITSKGRFISGTGAYRGAKGSFKFSGSTAPGSSVVTGKSTGTIAY